MQIFGADEEKAEIYRTAIMNVFVSLVYSLTFFLGFLGAMCSGTRGSALLMDLGRPHVVWILNLRG